MVTGIETTGLVLAILPLIINQLDSYVQGVETIKSFRTKRYRRYLDEHAAMLGGQHAILLNCLETILEDVVPEYQISILLADTQDPLWADPILQRDLKQRLGRSYTPFCDIMSQVSHVLEELAIKMGLSLGTATTKTQPFGASQGFQRIKDIFSKNICKELFQDLEYMNNIIRTLVEQSVTRSTQRRLKTRSKESTRRYKAIRQTTASLYEAIMNKAYWQCACFDTHTLHFFLNKDINVCERLEPDGVRLVFMTSPTTTASTKWHEIQAKTAENCSTSVNLPPPIMTRSRTLRSAPPPANSTIYATPGTSSNAPSSQISNICEAIYGCLTPTDQGLPIGYLSDGNYTHNFQVLKAGAGKFEVHSLEDLLLASLTISGNFRTPFIFPKRDRRFLAAKLASTVLECHGSWLPSRWSSRNIIFTGNITSTNLEKSIQTPVIARKLSDYTEFEGYSLSGAGYNDILFPLGLVLIELSLGRTITSLHTPGDGGQDGSTAQFEQVRSWIYDVCCECGPNYGDVVQQCLIWTKTREVNIENEEFQAAVFQYIIKPLVEDYRQFNDP
ncbi:uncharacterized protein N7503_011767 [Penicillium pulvis]|uniref:uncharacterized protein n=1 Tax=Penicillium pulvis TaxID=1562058 RepID=UPI00254981A8|nr:uncharacterized protein N7503_011767 [Penicillium pulvis]KAJ5786555.1 hypothetical protein N7503_011767 [Penicillium pulvis]